MKRNDYINIQAPMISDLHLKGNELLVFALIHGYTKDGKSKCRVSLSYMANWICTNKSMVIKVINTLEKAGYVNRHEYMEGLVRCVEYTTNYEALLDRVANGELVSLEGAKKRPGVKMTPATECLQSEGCQNNTGVKMTTKGCQNDIERGVKMVPNNKYIINYNNFSCAELAQQEEEKREFFKIFFFRNAVDPAAEVDKFIAYYDSIEWRNDKGRTYETPEQRLGLAKLWKLKEEGQWARPEYVKAIKAIYAEAIKQSIEGVEALIDQRVNLKWNGRSQVWEWDITIAAHQWVQEHFDLVKKHIKPILGPKTSVTYKQVA